MASFVRQPRRRRLLVALSTLWKILPARSWKNEEKGGGGGEKKKQKKRTEEDTRSGGVLLLANLIVSLSPVSTRADRCPVNLQFANVDIDHLPPIHYRFTLFCRTPVCTPRVYTAADRFASITMTRDQRYPALSRIIGYPRANSSVCLSFRSRLSTFNYRRFYRTVLRE